jgi:GTP-binding protein
MSGQRSHPLYQRATFVVAAHQLHQLPTDGGIEVAFAGRSNAGKSTAVNAITSRRALARTSKTPGRTQQIVIFELDDERRFADLPGYGYAKVPMSVKRHWVKTLDLYLRSRHCLRGLVLIMDVRHPLKEFDLKMLHWCKSAGVSCHALLTKADKLKRGAAGKALSGVEKALKEQGLPATVQLFSGSSGMGVEAAHRVLDEWFDWNPGPAAGQVGPD